MSNLNTSATNQCQKSWNSERSPLPTGSSKRYSNSSLLPFLNGRTMPSKWDDAEKWIFNPISAESRGSPFLSLNQYKRPMSKSGPLKTPTASAGISYLASSPLQKRVSEEISKRQSFPVSSPFLTGVFMADNGCYRGERGGGGERNRVSTSHADQGAAPNSRVLLWSDLSAGSSSSSEIFQDDHLQAVNADSMLSSEIQRKDVGTQISPDESVSSSPKERRFSRSSSSPSTSVDHSLHPPKLEIRDVQVDKAQVESVDRKKRSMVEPRASAWETSEPEKLESKLKRAEVKINDWENFQKAKAEAAINRLEMKLDKERSASMEKIMRDLKLAQEKARGMKNALEAKKSGQKKRAKMKFPIYFSNCFACHTS